MAAFTDFRLRAPLPKVSQTRMLIPRLQTLILFHPGENIQLLDSLPRNQPPQSSSTEQNKGPNYGATAVSVEVKTPTQDDEQAKLLQNTQESSQQASQTGNSYTHPTEVRIMRGCCEVVKNWFKGVVLKHTRTLLVSWGAC